MADFRKVYCMYHPQEFITNFCKDRNCLMPLCPSCIGPHNDYHDKSGYRANYLNIFDSLAQAQTLIYDLLINIEQDKKRNDEVIQHIHNLPMIIHEKVVLAKNMAYNAMERAFEELEKQILYIMDKKHQEAGIYSLSRAEKHQAQLIEGIADLYEMTQSLKNEKCLSSMIKFYSQSQAELNVLHNQISASLYVNENYVPSIDINEEAVGNMTGLVSRFVNVSFSFPNQLDTFTKDVTKYGGVSHLKKTAPTQTIVQRSMPSNSRTYATVYHPVPAQTTVQNQPIGISTMSQIQSPPLLSYNGKNNKPIQYPVNPRTKTPTRSHIDTTTSPKKYNHLGNTNYDEEFDNLSRKVREMRKQNEILSKALKNF